MTNNKLFIVLSVLAIVVVSVGALIFFFDKLRIVDNYNKVVERFIPKSFDYNIDNKVNNQEYRIDEKVVNYAEIQEYTAGTPILDLKQNVSIVPDDENIIFSFLRPDGSTSSGFWFENTGEELNIFIYIDPASSMQEALFDLNRSYLLSLLYAAENWKAEQSLSGETPYQPKLKEARQVTMDIVMDAVKYNDYFITNAN